MGIYEEQEELFELICEKFSNISGMWTGVEEDTVVYSKTGMLLWSDICLALKIKAKFVSGLHTIEDYVHEFAHIIQKHNEQRAEFLLQLQQFVNEKTGHIYAPDEQLCSEKMPKPLDEDTATKLGKQQFLREEMAFALAVDNLKIAIRNKFGYFKYSTSYYKAQTLDEITDVLFGKDYLYL